MGRWDLGLKGQELLNKLEELGDSASEKEQMIATGWFTLREDGYVEPGHAAGHQEID